MSEFERSPLPQDKTIRQVASLSQTLAGNHLAFVALGVYLAIQTKGAWQAYAIILLALSAVIGALIATNLIRRGQLRRGGWILFTTDWIAPAFAAWVLADFSLVSIGFILVTAYFIITFGMVKESRRAAWINTAVVLLIPIAARIIDPTWRLISAFMLTASPIVTVILGIALLFIIIQRALTRGNVRTKLLVPTLLFIALLISAIVGYNGFISIQQFDADEEGRLKTMHDIFLARISSDEDFAVALAIQTAQNIDIQKTFAEQDRDRLIELTLPSYEGLDGRFGVPQHQFHLPPATSFLRLHNLDNYGDDLSTFRLTVLEANEEKRVISGLEVGRGGLGIRGVSPVKYQGEHIGTVEFGLNVDQTLLSTLKDEFGYDFQLSISKEAAEIATLSPPEAFSSIKSDQIFLLATTLANPFLADENNYIQALAGTHALTHLTIDNNEYAVDTVPLVDFSGKVIGTLDIISDHTEILTQQRQQIFISIGILLASLLAVGVGFYLIAGRTLRPISTLTASANAIAAGDFTQSAKVESDDELGVLATTFNSMAAQIEENVRTLEDRVAARTKDQAVVAEIATEIASVQEMDEMLAQMVHLTQRGFGLYHAHVFTFHEEDVGDELRIIACGYREGDEHEGTHGTSTIAFNLESSIVARCARERKPIIINDVRNSPDWLPNPLLPETQAEMAIPLLVGDPLMGALDVQSEHLDAFSTDDANIQSTLASQIAVAMQNLLQYETSQKVATDLSVVAKVGIATATITDKDHLLQEIVDLSKNSFGLYHAHIYLLNDAGDSLDLTSGAGEVGRKMVTQGLSIPLDREQSLVARAARTQEGVVVNDVTQDANFLPNPLLPDTHAEMAVPMVVAGKVLGVLDIQSEQAGRFTNVDVNIQTTLASQIAVALENARSFENTQKQAEQETRLNLITQKIQQTGTIEEAMQIAARELGQALGSPQTLVALNTSTLSGKDSEKAIDEA